MADNASRRGAANLGVPLMIVAFLAMLGFMYWLSLQQGTDQNVAVSEDSAAADTSGIAGASTVSGTDLANAQPLAGELVRVSGLTVASQLGQQGFWLNLPSGSPFLVAFSPALLADSLAPQTGQIADVVGRVKEMSDSVVSAWTAAGTISEGDRAAAGFADYYIDATRVTLKQGGAGSSAGG